MMVAKVTSRRVGLRVTGGRPARRRRDQDEGEGEHVRNFRIFRNRSASSVLLTVKQSLMMTFPGSWLRSSQSARSPELTETSDEITVSQYFNDYVECGKPGAIFIVRKPIKSLRALVALCRVPCLSVGLSPDEVEGAAIRASLLPRTLLTWLVGYPTAVLPLPGEPGEYTQGASRRTLRNKANRAERAGVYWERLSDIRQRRNILKLADDFERTHPDVTHRNPYPDNSALLDYRLWLVAYASDGQPLLLAVTPFSGQLALLSYFRTLGVGQDYSNARYLMFQVLAEQLVSRRVRYLLSGATLALPNGVRHFQRMLGFRVVRLRPAKR
jgi:hypothetical protein